MQNASSRIPTQITMFISYGDNRFTTSVLILVAAYLIHYRFVVFFHSLSNLFGSFNAELNFKQFSLVYFFFFVYTQLNVKTANVKIQFSVSTQFTSIWPIDRTLLGVTTPGQSGLGSDGNEGVLYIFQSASITGASPSDCLVSYQDIRWGNLTLCRDAVGVFCSLSQLGQTSLRESYPCAEMQSMYSTVSADWTKFTTGF